MSREDIYIPCSCTSMDHVVCFRLVDNSEEDKWPDVDLYLNVQMKHSYGFFSKVWIALKYVFKSTPCNYGYWNETLIEPDSARQIISTCEKYIELEGKLNDK